MALRGGAVPLSRRIFDKYDADGSGEISPEEFREMVYEMGYFLSEKEFSVAILMLDLDGSGEISYDEFLKWWRTDERFKKLQLTDAQFELMQHTSAYFQYFDKDSSGTLDREEFRQCHADLVKNCVTDMDFERCMANLDTDGNGEVSFNEYVDYLIRIGSISLADADQGVAAYNSASSDTSSATAAATAGSTSTAGATAAAAPPAAAGNDDDDDDEDDEVMQALVEEMRQRQAAAEAALKEQEALTSSGAAPKLSREATVLSNLKKQPDASKLQRLQTMRQERVAAFRENTPKAIERQMTLRHKGDRQSFLVQLRNTRESMAQLQVAAAKPPEKAAECEHKFLRHKFDEPTYCFHCQKLLWSLGHRGYRCTHCEVAVHGGKCRRDSDPKRKSRFHSRSRSRSRSPRRK
jgi:Ca2+-binding EF-hand superfamily protein